MSVNIYYSDSLSPQKYDKLLASGFFRGGNFLYKSDFICFDEQISAVINIRLKLDAYQISRSKRKLINKTQNKFTVIMNPAQLTNAKEELYQRFKKRFSGFVYHSLEEFLFGFDELPLYNTYEMCVYDGEQLLAFSLFDIGNNSMASLLAVYDPDYKKHSLGTFTLFYEIDYALRQNLKFYYPGYILDNNSAFDYKLDIGAMQYYNDNRRWSKLADDKKIQAKTLSLNNKFDDMEALLKKRQIHCKKKLNPFHTLGYIDESPVPFIKSLSPFIINKRKKKILLDYDYVDNIYVLSFISKAQKYNYIKHLYDTSYYKDKDIYLMDLYYYKHHIMESESLHEIVEYIYE